MESLMPGSWSRLDKSPFRMEITLQLSSPPIYSGAALSLCLQSAALVFAEGAPACSLCTRACRRRLPRKQDLASQRASLLFILSSDDSLLLVTY